MTVATPPTARKNAGWFSYGFATLVLLGFVSWAAQFLAAATFGITEYFSWDVRSTCGAVALLSAIAMWIWCRSWQSWREWIWVPIIITVVIAFVAMSINAQTVAAIEAEQARIAEAAAACDALWEEGQAKAAEIDQLYADYGARADSPSWADSFKDSPSWANPGEPPAFVAGPLKADLEKIAAEYNSTC